ACQRRRKPATKPISTIVNLFDGETYGVGIPIVVDFGSSIPSADRAAVQSRLFVTSLPAQVGAWRWISSTEVVYRPRSYWKPGTAVTFRSALGGLPIAVRVIDKDRTAKARIGRASQVAVNDGSQLQTIA